MRRRLLEDGGIETLECHYDEADWPRVQMLVVQGLVVQRRMSMLAPELQHGER